jgi:hypothetical protein
LIMADVFQTHFGCRSLDAKVGLAETGEEI